MAELATGARVMDDPLKHAETAGKAGQVLLEMAEPHKWGRVMDLTYSVVLPLYWGVGTLGYVAYGYYAKANINLNFPRNAMNVFSLAIQVRRLRRLGM